jgi:hypothetical protein
LWAFTVSSGGFKENFVSLLANFPERGPPIDGGTACALVIVVLVASFLGAFILRAVCGLYNKLAGGSHKPNSVPEPEYNTAIAIIFACMLVQAGAGLALRFLDLANPISTIAISLPLGVAVNAGMLSVMLPTTFVRGLLVALLWFMVSTAFALIFFAVVAIACGWFLAPAHAVG